MAKSKSQGSIIILSGPVGAGKTTVAKELVAITTKPTVYIEGDKFWFFIVKDHEKKTQHKNFRMIMSSMMAAAVPYAAHGFEVILDFSFPPWYLDTARRIASVRNIPLDYIILLPDEATCAKRAANRKEGAIADYSTYHDMYADFVFKERHLFREQENDIGTTAKKIREGLDVNLFRLI